MGEIAKKTIEQAKIENKKDVPEGSSVTHPKGHESPMHGNTEPLNGEASGAVPATESTGEKKSGLLSWFPRI